jgi:hypothetical protein
MSIAVVTLALDPALVPALETTTTKKKKKNKNKNQKPTKTRKTTKRNSTNYIVLFVATFFVSSANTVLVRMTTKCRKTCAVNFTSWASALVSVVVSGIPTGFVHVAPLGNESNESKAEAKAETKVEVEVVLEHVKARKPCLLLPLPDSLLFVSRFA